MRTLEKRWEMRTAVLPSRQLLEALEHLELGPRVEGRGGLVQDQELRVAHVGARDGDLLPLAAGEVDAGLEALADHLVVAGGQLRDDLVGQARVGGGLDARAVVAGLDAPHRDVLGRGQVVAHEVLEDDADVRAQRGEVVLAQVVAVEEDPALVGVVEAREQLDQRRLARRRSRPPAPAPRPRAG